MDEAVWKAFQHADFDDMLDKLAVPTMNFRHLWHTRCDIFLDGRLAVLVCGEHVCLCRRAVDGTTPLMAACRHGHLPVVHLLLDLNCDAIVLDEYGASAQDHAVRFGFLEVKLNANLSLLSCIIQYFRCQLHR